jgi:aminomethyltransferase
VRPEGRAPIRHGAQLFAGPASADAIGVVTSGGFGPSVNGPIAMGYVPVAVASGDAPIFAELRGERVPMRITELPFISPKYKR